MTSINPINVNTQGIGAKTGYGTQAKQEKETDETKQPQVSSEKTAVSADKVLDYLSASSVGAAMVTKKTIDPSKYVDEASAARIASFMGSFEDKVAEGLAAFDKEFAGVNVSDSTKMTLVLAQLNKEME